MGQLMLINPRKRKTRKTRSAAQKAATARMIAARHGKRRSSHAKRRHNPIGLSRLSSRVRHHRRRRNPISVASGGGAVGMLLNSLKGATGAVAVNAVTNLLPAMAKTGKMLYVTRAIVALGIGTLGSRVLGHNAKVMAEGALTVNTYEFINNLAGGILPGSGLHGVGEYMSGVGEYMPLNGVGEYLSADDAASYTPAMPEQSFVGNY